MLTTKTKYKPFGRKYTKGAWALRYLLNILLFSLAMLGVICCSSTEVNPSAPNFVLVRPTYPEFWDENDEFVVKIVYDEEGNRCAQMPYETWKQVLNYIVTNEAAFDAYEKAQNGTSN